jgi:hypothetical protein
VVGGGGAYRLAVFSSDAVNRVSDGMDCSHHTGDVTRSGGQVCWIADRFAATPGVTATVVGDHASDPGELLGPGTPG